MSSRSFWLLSRAITLTMTVVAVLVIRWIWTGYERSPWTRDARVRADIVSVAPDVPGWVVKVWVTDNQVVRKGEIGRAHV